MKHTIFKERIFIYTHLLSDNMQLQRQKQIIGMFPQRVHSCNVINSLVNPIPTYN